MAPRLASHHNPKSKIYNLTPLLFLFAACSPNQNEVVVYTSVDQVYAQNVFKAFTRETGLRVRPIFDTEEAKTLGLVHRLVAEREHPQADVFWNGECARTAWLHSEGLIQPFRATSAEGISPTWRDFGDAWTGFAARARVIVYNTERVTSPPKTLHELADPKWKGRVAMANPLFGTTASHVAALSQEMGSDETLALLNAYTANDIRIVGGNSHVRDLVARGTCDVGLTDTDDVWIGKLRGDPIEMIFPDQEGMGTLVIPNSVALVKGAPRTKAAQRFIEFLLRPETEALLAQGRSRQMPVRPGVKTAEGVTPLSSIRAMDVDWNAVARAEPFLRKAREVLK